jgi:5-methylcytosine-specific restriction endonuclease McrA
MNILDYRDNPRFSACPSAFLVTGTKDDDKFNRSLLTKNQTGNWFVKAGRVKNGDAIFLILPSLNKTDGYPREFYCGVVEGTSTRVNDRKLFKVVEFVKLPPIQAKVKDFLLGKTPPQGNTVATVWEPQELSAQVTTKVVAEKTRKPKSLSANYLGRQISVSDAISIRDTLKQKKGGSLVFNCLECRGSVWPHQSGGKSAAHFEHLDHDPTCPLCATYRNVKTFSANKQADLDSASAIEGHAQDRRFLSLKRNRAIVAKCKDRDKYTCRACGYKLEIEGRFVIECHHLNPLSVVGEGVVSVKDLVSLCPTCHRVAHTKKTPIPLVELRVIVKKAKKRIYEN